MRQIGTLSHETEAQRFSNYLKSKGIANTCDVSFDAATGQMSYQIWAHDEDRLREAISALEEFRENPSLFKFDSHVQEEPPIVEEPLQQVIIYRFRGHLTTFLVALCAMIFFLNILEEVPILEEGLSQSSTMLTPLQAMLMYDLPPAFGELEKIIEKYEIAGKKYAEIPSEIKNQIALVEKTPYWQGIYSWIVYKIKGQDTSSITGPLLLRIRQGEIWRLISPVVLHSNFLHILFNMLWLWYLGRPIEQRIGPFRTLLLSLVAGIGSNTVQYFMSGPFFIGYSGIVAALAGFIWMREKIAPWEGYPIPSNVIYFLAFFIGAIVILDVVAFCLQAFTSVAFAPNIANSAHIAGALIGIFLARYPFFSQRVHK